MATVIVVGAGATLAQAQGYRPKQTKEHPPLDLGFFDKAQSLAPSNPTVRRKLGDLGRALERSGGFLDPTSQPGIRLEQFFADVYYEVADARSETAFAVFIELLRLYNRVIGETTNWLGSHSRLGVVDRLLRHEVAESDGLVTVVTFNQDLLLENVAYKFPGDKDRWCLDSLYGDPGLSPLVRGSAVFTPHADNCVHEPPFRLLKLHGSLNWMVRTRDRDPSLGTLFPRKSKTYYALDTRVVELGGRVRTGGGSGRTQWYLWPLVVPPIYEKHRLTATSVIQSVWSRAREAISQASKVVVLGYSLPDADVSAAQMLRRAFNENAALEAIHCVNPDYAIVGKLRERLGANVVHMYTDLPTYLAHEVL